MRARKVLFAIVHAMVLVAPAIALGRISEATRARAIAIVALLVFLSLVESNVVDRLGGLRSRHDGARLALLSSFALLGTAWLAIAGPGTRALTPWVGLVFGVSGIALRASAIRALGAGFSSAIDPGPVLVVRGIYGHVRHPSDLGLFLLSTGIALLGENLLGGVCVLFVGLTIALRVRREEAALSKRFQRAHAVYRRRVPSLLPRMASARLGC